MPQSIAPMRATVQAISENAKKRAALAQNAESDWEPAAAVYAPGIPFELMLSNLSLTSTEATGSPESTATDTTLETDVLEGKEMPTLAI
ncbi:hypothetical protein FB45DRAFT_1019001 [Roridomyces roridus]|uniref:Uncharacterized protein n=1 Tax=Roridomyces roridus TaxID=1738132 RepID=A0AAD7CE50_9AGAR|nr:hypothetical protein FB45DRAFT_1019001 [Roridomyces roridus]